MFRILFKINNITLIKKEIKYIETYKKYLGEDYNFSQTDYSIFISNHLDYLEIAAYMKEYGVSYLITFELLKAPSVGSALMELGSFFVDREDEKSRKKNFRNFN